MGTGKMLQSIKILLAVSLVCMVLFPSNNLLEIRPVHGKASTLRSIHYTLDFAQRAFNNVSVTMFMDGIPTGSDLWLFRSSGSYKDKRVFIESCKDDVGNKLTLEQIDNNTFLMSPGSKSVEIRYTVHVGEKDVCVEGYSSYVSGDFAIIQEDTVFLRPSVKFESVEVDIVAPPSWRILTVHQMDTPTSFTADPNLMWKTYLALGEFEVRSTKAVLGNVEVVVASLGSTLHLVEEYVKYLPKLLDIYSLAVGKYSFEKLLAILAPSIMQPGQQLSGAICIGAPEWPIVAHELFHEWNRRVFILETDEEEFAVTWFLEGFTEYYAFMGLLKAEILYGYGFSQRLLEYGLQYKSWVGTEYDLPIVEAWKVAREKEDSMYYQIPYVKGCLVAALLDQTLREKSGKNLDDLMKRLYTDFHSMKISNSIIEQSLDDLTGEDYRPFLNDYVYGTVELPIEKILEDQDNDRLLTIGERFLGSDPLNADTDGDGIKDGGDQHPLDPMPETALKMLDSAEAAVMRAEQEGRVQGLDMARQKLATARSAYDSSQYETAISLAKEVLELAERVAVATITTANITETATLPTQPNWLQTSWLYVAILTMVTAIAIILATRKLRAKRG